MGLLDGRIESVAELRRVRLAMRRHEQEHYCLRPPRVPLDSLARDNVFEDNYLIVSGGWDLFGPITPSSTQGIRRAVWKLGRYFQLEGGYDFPAYNDRSLKPSQAFLWLDKGLEDGDPLGVGACCFYPCESSPSGWTMGWVWLHPLIRRRYALRGAWEALTDRFGTFTLTWPLSDSMVRYLNKLPDDDPIKKTDIGKLESTILRLNAEKRELERKLMGMTDE